MSIVSQVKQIRAIAACGLLLLQAVNKSRLQIDNIRAMFSEGIRKAQAG